ncbi:hypothetical protein Vretifemale_16015, partial [Volvox reticuliferus]
MVATAVAGVVSAATNGGGATTAIRTDHRQAATSAVAVRMTTGGRRLRRRIDAGLFGVGDDEGVPPPGVVDYGGAAAAEAAGPSGAGWDDGAFDMDADGKGTAPFTHDDGDGGNARG